MYSDRELLELAAKTAGHALGPDWNCLPSGIFINGDDSFSGVEWTPLTDDGDALRLAVKMGLTIDCDGRGITARKSFGGAQIVLSAESEYGPPDVNARMRRCIVRAAAAHIERGYQ